MKMHLNVVFLWKVNIAVSIEMIENCTYFNILRSQQCLNRI